MELTWNPPQIESKTCTYEWTVDYASEVHNGFEGFSERTPARPWVYKTVQQYFDVPAELSENFLNSKDINQAFIDTAVDLSDAFSSVMKLPVFYWPNVTKRTNDEVVGSPRNIKDQGDLINSQRYFFS